jgi:uncharacterized DUF497 family protein
VDFEWDDAKDRSNRAKHAISFDEAIAVFADPDVVVLDVSRSQDGETRLKAIGLIEGELLVVVFSERGRVTRIISARRANRNEERSYGDRESKA